MKVHELKTLLQSTNILNIYTISYQSTNAIKVNISNNNTRYKIDISNINNLEDFLKVLSSLEF